MGGKSSNEQEAGEGGVGTWPQEGGRQPGGVARRLLVMQSEAASEAEGRCYSRGHWRNAEGQRAACGAASSCPVSRPQTVGERGKCTPTTSTGRARGLGADRANVRVEPVRVRPDGLGPAGDGARPRRFRGCSMNDAPAGYATTASHARATHPFAGVTVVPAC